MEYSKYVIVDSGLIFPDHHGGATVVGVRPKYKVAWTKSV